MEIRDPIECSGRLCPSAVGKASGFPAYAARFSLLRPSWKAQPSSLSEGGSSGHAPRGRAEPPARQAAEPQVVAGQTEGNLGKPRKRASKATGKDGKRDENSKKMLNCTERTMLSHLDSIKLSRKRTQNELIFGCKKGQLELKTSRNSQLGREKPLRSRRPSHKAGQRSVMKGRRCSTSFQALAYVVGPNGVRRGARAGGLRAERRSALRNSFDYGKAAVRCSVIRRRVPSITKLRQRMVARENLFPRNEAGMLLKTKDRCGGSAEQSRNIVDNK